MLHASQSVKAQSSSCEKDPSLILGASVSLRPYLLEPSPFWDSIFYAHLIPAFRVLSFSLLSLRSGASFKLKLRLPVSELWLQCSIDGVSESNVAASKSFVIGWPTVSYVATFRYEILICKVQCIQSQKRLHRIRRITKKS